MNDMPVHDPATGEIIEAATAPTRGDGRRLWRMQLWDDIRVLAERHIEAPADDDDIVEIGSGSAGTAPP